MIDISCQKSLSDSFHLDVNFQIKKGDFVAFYGKSGSGKTTILRIIAGFLKPDNGYIKNGSLVYCDKNYYLEPQKRNIGYLFQDYALFPNMSVIKNLLFANNDKKLANELLNLAGLDEHKNSSINALSGGQKQRVALARALMRKPDILLLDEPLSALDNEIRQKLQDYLLKIHENFGMTIILVSHDVGEIYKLANVVYELNNGKMINIGMPSEIFLKPSGSQKFSFHAKILEIQKRDTIYVVIAECANQISEVVLTKNEVLNLKTGDIVTLSAKAFKISVKGIK
ncbi:ABC transporter ATP-binding protein [Campylobacter fetus]|uniref:ABC transporter ATP-binding protein n=1 Tax=Campylobacter fetus TaxID=196 RepID=UPI00118A5100|nr:ABC transporter ATP-binding protein [Campylobacter fetus]QDS03968.1 ABC transporter ATP-binding protein [Campylobacter fetus subsp. fetus]